MLPEVICDQNTRDKLGEDGLAEVRASLWAQDCQSCGRPLGSGPPALCVDDVSEFATASLHHPRCRPARWNDGSVIYAAGGDMVSWCARTFMLPAMAGRKADPRPVLLVNPGLEMIMLEPGGGTWRPAYHRQFESLGLVPPGRRLRIDRAVPGAFARMTASSVSVTVESPPPQTYDADAEGEILARAQELRGVLLMITHALNPATLTGQDIRQLLQSGRVICGWVAVGA